MRRFSWPWNCQKLYLSLGGSLVSSNTLISNFLCFDTPHSFIEEYQQVKTTHNLNHVNSSACSVILCLISFS